MKAEKLDTWLECAVKNGYRVWSNYAPGLIQDKKAGHAALLYPWSNGPTEGHVNRLECLKRLMYGRAKDGFCENAFYGKESYISHKLGGPHLGPRF
jgi:transposase